LLSPETLSPEAIAAFKEADSENDWPGSLFGSSFQNSENRIWFGVCVRGRLYTLSGSGLDVKTAYEIIKAVL